MPHTKKKVDITAHLTATIESEGLPLAERLALADVDVDVDAYMGDETGGASVERDVPRPKIESLDDAAKYAYGLSETKKEIERVLLIAQTERARWEGLISQVVEWEEQTVRPLQEKLNYFELLLSEYHKTEFDAAPNPKAQSKVATIKLPYGVSLCSRKLPTRIEVTDNERLLAYATQVGQVNVPPPTAKWGEIKKSLTVTPAGVVVSPDGEVLDFVEAVEQGRKSEVK